MAHTPDLAEARRILERESEARLALKAAKAKAYLGQVAMGQQSTIAWQQVALTTAQLEADYEAAHNEKLLLWLQHGLNGGQPGE